MDSIVWDSKRETEKERDYVKLVYRYPLNELYDDDEVQKSYDAIVKAKKENTLPNIPSVMTPQGKVVLTLVRDNIQKVARKNIESLMEANSQVRAKFGN